MRGRALRLRDHAGHVPVGLLRNAVLARDVDADALLTFDDVELPDSLALTAWRQIEARAVPSTPDPA